MWDLEFLIPVALTAGIILLAYGGAEAAYRRQERARQKRHHTKEVVS